MDRLEKRVLDFIKLDQSEEFKAADRVVKKHATALEYIKSEFKKQGKTEMSVVEHDDSFELCFMIRTQMRVDVKALPMDIRDTYLTTTEVWMRNVRVWKRKRGVEEEDGEGSKSPRLE
ncbi:hypothetical protein DFS34DRAFT_652842 [Phlyctochytrium arcticum]|nr:hypothetical protein DFS34DRAFT_652842 [Phlyctochytrium arcticum]